MAMEPVRPRTPHQSVASISARKLGRDLGPNAEPGLEPRYRLVQQHAEPVDSAQAARRGGGEKRRLERHIDQIGDQRVGWQGAQIKPIEPRAVHADRAGVDHQPRLAGTRRELFEAAGADGAVEIECQLRGLAGGPVEQVRAAEAS